MAPSLSGLDRFFALLESACRDETLVKLTLGKHRGPDPTLKNLFIRPIRLRGVWQLSFLYRHATRDITKNHAPDEAIQRLRELLPQDFRDAHLFTPAQTAQLTCDDDGRSSLRTKLATSAPTPPPAQHDRSKTRLIAEDRPWLFDLGVTLTGGKVRDGMMSKFRQINRFVELVDPLVKQADLLAQAEPFRVADMGCGKGYLTFALADHYQGRARVLGIESRPDLVLAGNRIAAARGLSQLEFKAGQITDTDPGSIEVLIALHACDTATDDALHVGIQKGARVLVVSPCCQKELRAQLRPAEVLAPSLRHGIFAERHAEFATDAMRALLLEWVGYQTQVFEFITTEHTAKNLMIAAVKPSLPDPGKRDRAASALRALAGLYGVTEHRLAKHLGFNF